MNLLVITAIMMMTEDGESAHVYSEMIDNKLQQKHPLNLLLLIEMNSVQITTAFDKLPRLLRDSIMNCNLRISIYDLITCLIFNAK